MSKRVLIYYASIGSGHLAAAEALRAALLECDPAAEVGLADVFTTRQRLFGLPGMLAAASTMLFPRVYDRSWRTGSMRWSFELIRRLPWFERRVIQQARQFAPDVVVCTHTLPCAIVAARLASVPLAAVATDFYAHPYWPVRGVDAFITAGEITVPALVARGFPAQRIFPLGIPVNPRLASLVQPAADSTHSAGLRVLVLAGGGQVGPYLPIWGGVAELINLLARSPLPGVSWDFVFGHSRKLEYRAARLLAGRADVSINGFVSDVPERMARADVVLTKPGGLALAEAMALRKPVILLSRGAGQEAANRTAVLAANAGVLATTAEKILSQLMHWRNSPDELERVKLGTGKLGSPESARRSARLILSLSRQDGSSIDNW